MTNKKYDVIIVGAGPVGALLALQLAQQHFAVALIDNQVLPPQATVHRMSALNQASCEILETWQCLLSDEDATPFYEIEVFEEKSPRLLHFTAQEIAQAYLGKIISNHALTQTLQQRAQNEKIDFMCPVSIKAIHVLKEDARVLLHDNNVLHAKLVIGADGAHSKVRELLGFTFNSQTYGESALVAEVTTQAPHHNIARQVFLPTGPVAFLPLSDSHKVSLVWSGVPTLIDSLMQLSAPAFCEALKQAWNGRLGDIEQVRERARFELTMRHAHEYVRDRVALVGDALHTIHPLAGQGLNLGLADAVSLAEVLIKAKQQQQDIGSLPVLRRFARMRRAPNALMLASMKGFQQGFKLNSAPAVQIRQWLLKGFDNLPFLKRAALRYGVNFSIL